MQLRDAGVSDIWKSGDCTFCTADRFYSFRREPEQAGPEAERRILALRLVTMRTDRLSGRTLRQSLAGCGFRHGPMSIFHLAVPDGRVILSAANLASPGELDPRTMDFQRFAGINLFAVLPGPLEAEATAARLVRVASEMSRRLDAAIQDEEGTAVEPAQLQHLATRLLARANSSPGASD
jgi:FtsZ-interacting cell division protein ZipA